MDDTRSNGALIHRPASGAEPGDADLALTLTKPQLLAMLAGRGMDGVEHTGDPNVLQRVIGLLDTPTPGSRS